MWLYSCARKPTARVHLFNAVVSFFPWNNTRRVSLWFLSVFQFSVSKSLSSVFERRRIYWHLAVLKFTPFAMWRRVAGLVFSIFNSDFIFNGQGQGVFGSWRRDVSLKRHWVTHQHSVTYIKPESTCFFRLIALPSTLNIIITNYCQYHHSTFFSAEGHSIIDT